MAGPSGGSAAVPASPAEVPAVAHAYSDRLDDSIRIDGDDGHHLHRVRRIRPGETVTVADGYGRWRVYDVAEVSEGTLRLAATTELQHESPLEPALAVACSLTKGDRPELVVQKLTELGVDRIVFVEAERSIVHWDDARAGAAMARLGRIAREAGAQSRRSRFAVVDGPVQPPEIASHPGLIVADLTGVTVTDLVLLPAPASHPEWLVAVGPEGGFSEAERDAFGAAPRLAVGSYVLRAETAAIACAAALSGFRRRTAP